MAVVITDERAVAALAHAMRISPEEAAQRIAEGVQRTAETAVVVGTPPVPFPEPAE